MKLEVGKFYIVRDPERAGVEKVRVDCIRPEKSLGSNQVACTAFEFGGIVSSHSCTYTGKYLGRSEDDPLDLISEHNEPSLYLSEIDIGRKVQLRNGCIAMIIGFQPATEEEDREEIYLGGWGLYPRSGIHGSNPEYDIIKFVD